MFSYVITHVHHVVKRLLICFLKRFFLAFNANTFMCLRLENKKKCFCERSHVIVWEEFYRIYVQTLSEFFAKTNVNNNQWASWNEDFNLIGRKFQRCEPITISIDWRPNRRWEHPSPFHWIGSSCHHLQCTKYDRPSKETCSGIYKICELQKLEAWELLKLLVFTEALFSWTVMAVSLNSTNAIIKSVRRVNVFGGLKAPSDHNICSQSDFV